MTKPIAPGTLVLKDPAAVERRVFDWASHLGSETILASAGVFRVVAAKPREAVITLAVDQAALADGARSVEFRLSGGRRGTRYNVAHTAVTWEAFPQTLEYSFFVLIEDR